MFLHEPGEDNDSFTRQDLSMMNSIQTQQPSQSSTSRAAPPAHQGPPVAAATPMNRQDSNDTSSSIHEAPGLPATANWGSKAVLERRASRSTVASNNASPMITNAVPAQASKAPKPAEAPKKKGKDKGSEEGTTEQKDEDDADSKDDLKVESKEADEESSKDGDSTDSDDENVPPAARPRSPTSSSSVSESSWGEVS